MGFFKDLGTLSKQGRDMQNQMDVGASMANATAQMQAATAMMAQQTAAAQAAVTGVDATATVAGVRQTGMQVNFAPVVDLDLTVLAQQRDLASVRHLYDRRSDLYDVRAKRSVKVIRTE